MMRFLIQRGPCQPRLKLFPINETIAKNKQNKFKPSWNDSFPHLDYSRKEDKVFVLYALFPSGPGRERSDEAWLNGIRSWSKMKSVGSSKSGKLNQHFNSNSSHKAALADFAHFAIK